MTSTSGLGSSGPPPTEVVLDSARPTRSLLRLLRPHRWRLLAVVLIFIAKDSPLFLLPVITSTIVDVVVAGGPLREIAWLGSLAAVLLIQMYPLHMAFTRLYMDAVRSLAARLRGALAARLQMLSIGYHGRTSSSVVQSKLVRDIENIELMFSHVGNPLGSAVVVFVGALATTAMKIPEFLPVVALSVPMAAAVWWATKPRMRRRNEEFRLEMENYSRRVGEMSVLLPITRAHGLEDVALERVARDTEQVRRRGLRLDMVNGSFGSLTWVLMQLLATACVVAAAAVAVLGWAQVSAGDVVLLGTYFATLSGTVLTVLNLAPFVTRGQESVRSITEVLEEPDLELNEGKERLRGVTGTIEFSDVTVRYDGADSPALSHLDLRVEAGETVALVGASGSGKSTIVNTALGFVRAESGHVMLDGRDIDELDMRSVRRAVSVVPQESVLFHGSIRDNVCYGLEGVEDDAVREALAQANAEGIVNELPHGWDTVVGERGARLSGGQRQRISIARALIRNPRVLVLDEATSALDSDSERAVQEALDRLMEGRTTLIVAHRLSTVVGADRIVVLDHGRVVEQGTHDALLAARGRYAQMWHRQFS